MSRFIISRVQYYKENLLYNDTRHWVIKDWSPTCVRTRSAGAINTTCQWFIEKETCNKHKTYHAHTSVVIHWHVYFARQIVEVHFCFQLWYNWYIGFAVHGKLMCVALTATQASDTVHANGRQTNKPSKWRSVVPHDASIDWQASARQSLAHSDRERNDVRQEISPWGSVPEESQMRQVVITISQQHV